MAAAAFNISTQSVAKFIDLALCPRDLLVFMRRECALEVGPHHYEWWEMVRTGDDCVLLSPRDHGKSYFGYAWLAWQCKYNKFLKEAFLLTPDTPSASESMEKFKGILGRTPRLAELIPTTKKKRNAATAMTLTNGVTVRARSFRAGLRGRHPQIILCDDILSEENSLDVKQRRKTEARFMNVVLPMKDKGTEAMQAAGYKPQVLMPGTAQHREDLYHKLKEVGWPALIQDAIVDEASHLTLWPQRYTYDDLMEILRVRGPIYFSREYRNRPLAEESSLFPVRIFEPCKNRDLSYVPYYMGNMQVFLGVDFNVPGSLDGDFTVVLALAYDAEHNLFYLLNYWRAKAENVNQQLHEIAYYCKQYNVTLGYLENNVFQRIYANYFAEHSNLPLMGHETKAQNKNSMDIGVLALRTVIENERLILPYKTEADQMKTNHLILEFNGIIQRDGKIGNMEYHDDTVMALWHAWSCAGIGGSFKADFGK